MHLRLQFACMYMFALLVRACVRVRVLKRISKFCFALANECMLRCFIFSWRICANVLTDANIMYVSVNVFICMSVRTYHCWVAEERGQWHGRLRVLGVANMTRLLLLQPISNCRVKGCGGQCERRDGQKRKMDGVAGVWCGWRRAWQCGWR